MSADKSAKVWEISEDNNGKVKRTLPPPGSGGVDDMLVGCLWQNDHLVTVSLGGTISIFSASDLDKAPLLISGHMKNITSLAVLNSDPKVILSSSYDGLIVKWIQGVGYGGKLRRKENSQIKCLAAVEEEIVSCGFDNKVTRILFSFSLMQFDGFYFTFLFRRNFFLPDLDFTLSQFLSSCIFLITTQVWRVPVHSDQCGDAEPIDIGSQPKDISLALQSPELALVSTDTGVVMLRGTKVVSTINLGFTVTACTIAPDGSEAIVGGQDGKLHMYSIMGDTLKEEAVLEKHRGSISVIRYSPDVSMFASGDLNREAVIWDRVSREVVCSLSSATAYHFIILTPLFWYYCDLQYEKDRKKKKNLFRLVTCLCVSMHVCVEYADVCISPLSAAVLCLTKFSQTRE